MIPSLPSFFFYSERCLEFHLYLHSPSYSSYSSRLWFQTKVSREPLSRTPGNPLKDLLAELSLKIETGTDANQGDERMPGFSGGWSKVLKTF